MIVKAVARMIIRSVVRAIAMKIIGGLKKGSGLVRNSGA